MNGGWRAAIALLVCLSVAPALAQRAPAETATGSVRVAGRSVPLPAGAWFVVAETRFPAGTPPAARVRSAVLARVEGGVVAGLVSISVNEAWAPAGWGTTADCARTDIYRSTIDYQSATEISCSFANHVLSAVDPTAPGLWRDAAAALTKARWVLPQTWLMAGFRVGNRHDFIDVRYHFNPDTPAKATPETGWSEGPWSRQSIRLDPRRGALVEALLAWNAAARPVVERSLYGVENAGDLDWPWNGARSGASAAAASDAAESPPDWQISALKTVTWRAVGSLSDVVVAYAFTGSALISGGIAAVGAVVNSALYFVHEMAWQAYLPSGARRLPVLEVPTIGIAS